MPVADEPVWSDLIGDVVRSAQIPWEAKRRALARELRSYLEDSILAGREAGHSDDEIRRLVLARFGDPCQVTEGFAWVYRHERTIFRIALFPLSTLAVAGMLSAAILAMQAGLAIGFGASVLKTIASRHTAIEALDILSTVAVYTGLISLERLFDGQRLQKALTVVTLTFALAMAGCATADVHAPFLVFGFVSGVFLRTIQPIVKNSVVRTGIAAACFAAAGLLLFQAHPSPFHYALARNCASWFAMGAGYQLMAGLAPRLNEALSNALQRI